MRDKVHILNQLLDDIQFRYINTKYFYMIEVVNIKTEERRYISSGEFLFIYNSILSYGKYIIGNTVKL